jgi:hypothetical protein
VLIPLLHLKGISTGDFAEALTALVGSDAGSLSASIIARLKEVWTSILDRVLKSSGEYAPLPLLAPEPENSHVSELPISGKRNHLPMSEHSFEPRHKEMGRHAASQYRHRTAIKVLSQDSKSIV